MNKPDLLRAALTTAFPELADQPDRLRLWVEKGDARMAAGANIHFELRYTLTVLVEAWTQPALLLHGVILDWLRVHQPERTTMAAERALSFEADILNVGEVDVVFDLDISEAVAMIKRPDGGYDMQAHGEADPLFPDDEAMGGPLSELWLAGGDRILPPPPQPE